MFCQILGLSFFNGIFSCLSCFFESWGIYFMSKPNQSSYCLRSFKICNKSKLHGLHRAYSSFFWNGSNWKRGIRNFGTNKKLCMSCIVVEKIYSYETKDRWPFICAFRWQSSHKLPVLLSIKQLAWCCWFFPKSLYKSQSFRIGAASDSFPYGRSGLEIKKQVDGVPMPLQATLGLSNFYFYIDL